jgi:hypothetical protein
MVTFSDNQGDTSAQACEYVFQWWWNNRKPFPSIVSGCFGYASYASNGG